MSVFDIANSKTGKTKMEDKIDIPFAKFVCRPLDILSDQWMLLTAGDFQSGTFNTMTIGWGSFGTMWKKPFVTVVVRPTRHTHKFMEEYRDFTVCAFPRKYRKALQICGTKSGRDTDKIKEAGLMPEASSKIKSPAFREAELAIQCRKIYCDDFKPENFLSDEIEDNYPKKDYHRMYFGEILAIKGTRKYISPEASFESGNWKLEIGNWKLETGNWKLRKDSFKPDDQDS